MHSCSNPATHILAPSFIRNFNTFVPNTQSHLPDDGVIIHSAKPKFITPFSFGKTQQRPLSRQAAAFSAPIMGKTGGGKGGSGKGGKGNDKAPSKGKRRRDEGE